MAFKEIIQNVPMLRLALDNVGAISDVVRLSKGIINLANNLMHQENPPPTKHISTKTYTTKTVKYVNTTTTTKDVDLGQATPKDDLVKKYEFLGANHASFGNNQQLIQGFFGEKDAAEFASMLNMLNNGNNNNMVSMDSMLVGEGSFSLHAH